MTRNTRSMSEKRLRFSKDGDLLGRNFRITHISKTIRPIQTFRFIVQLNRQLF